jgi:predicted transcriptional regulator
MENNEKQYEFRKTIFDITRVQEAYIYSTAPVKKITASFKVGDVIRASPIDLWQKFGQVSGLSEEEFFQYYSGRSFGYAIKIEEFKRFDEPIDPYDLEGFVPPQSFCYFSNDDLKNAV